MNEVNPNKALQSVQRETLGFVLLTSTYGMIFRNGTNASLVFPYVRERTVNDECNSDR